MLKEKIIDFLPLIEYMELPLYINTEDEISFLSINNIITFLLNDNKIEILLFNTDISGKHVERIFYLEHNSLNIFCDFYKYELQGYFRKQKINTLLNNTL